MMLKAECLKAAGVISEAERLTIQARALARLEQTYVVMDRLGAMTPRRSVTMQGALWTR
jgi:hypothetical protein